MCAFWSRFRLAAITQAAHPIWGIATRHNQRRSKATKGGVPWVCVYTEEVDTRSQSSWVAFATLAEVGNAGEWCRMVLAQLKEDLPAGSEPLKYSGGLLRQRPTLLILDNFESVVQSATADLEALLSEVDGLRLLLTSAVPAKLRNEVLAATARRRFAMKTVIRP